MDYPYEDLIALYIANRKVKYQLKVKYEAEIADIDAEQQEIERMFAIESKDTKLVNFKTSNGTAYKYTQSRIKTVDKAAFTSFIMKECQWGLANISPYKNECVSWVKDTGLDLPGVEIKHIERFGFLSPGQKVSEEDE